VPYTRLLLLLLLLLPAAAAAAAAEKYFTLGDHPIRVAGMKVYSTAEDTCIMEMPLIWGSNAVVSSFFCGLLLICLWYRHTCSNRVVRSLPPH
jgi:hypothetical protein